MNKILNKNSLTWLAGLITLMVAPGIQAATLPTSSEANTASKARLVETYGKLSLSFEPNQGQTDEQVKFLSRVPGYSVFLTPTEAVLSLRGPSDSKAQPGTGAGGTITEPEAIQKRTGSVVRMRLIGANSEPQVTGLDGLPGKANYFISNDPKKWRTEVSTYAKVQYKNVYPGIDLIYYGNQRQLEYDFIVAPGSDPKTVRLGFEGADKLELDHQGDLIVHVGSEQIKLHKPLVYQDIGNIKKTISGRWVLKLESAAFSPIR